MTGALESRALARVPTMTSADELRRLMKNTKGVSPALHKSAFEQLVSISVTDQQDPIARACWEMVHTVEQIRREAGRKVWRMNRLRPKIEKDGVRAALAYCATHETDGFREVLDYGLPRHTAEAIVLRFPQAFPNEETRSLARRRLAFAGIDPLRFEPR